MAQNTLLFSLVAGAVTLASGALAERNSHRFDNGMTLSWYGWFHFAEQMFDDGVSTTSNPGQSRLKFDSGCELDSGGFIR